MATETGSQKFRLTLGDRGHFAESSPKTQMQDIQRKYSLFIDHHRHLLTRIS